MSNPQTPRRAPRKNTPSLAPLYGGIGIAILAIIAVAMAQKDKDARADAEKKAPVVNESTNPFDDLPPGGKAVPSPFGEGAGNFTPSVEGLMATPLWQDAVAQSERAKVLLKEAGDADKAGDRKTYHAKALEARELYHSALEATAQWELDISEAHGEADAQVSQIRALRSVWFDQRKKLRSVDVNDL